MCLHYTYYIIVKRYNFAMYLHIFAYSWGILQCVRCDNSNRKYIYAYQALFYIQAHFIRAEIIQGANSKGWLITGRKFYRAAFTSMTIFMIVMDVGLYMCLGFFSWSDTYLKQIINLEIRVTLLVSMYSCPFFMSLSLYSYLSVTSFCLYVCLSVYLSCLSVCPAVVRSVYLFICRVCLSV